MQPEHADNAEKDCKIVKKEVCEVVNEEICPDAEQHIIRNVDEIANVSTIGLIALDKAIIQEQIRNSGLSTSSKVFKELEKQLASIIQEQINSAREEQGGNQNTLQSGLNDNRQILIKIAEPGKGARCKHERVKG